MRLFQRYWVKTWTEALRPQTEPEGWLVRRAAVDSVRADAAERCERARTEARVRNDALYAQAQGIAEAGVASLGPQMLRATHRDVDKYLVRLRGTRAGCEWLLKRWRDLARIHRARGFWTEHVLHEAQWLAGGEFVEHIDDNGIMTPALARLCVDYMLCSPEKLERTRHIGELVERASWDVEAMLKADGGPGSPESIYAANKRLAAFIVDRIVELEHRVAVLRESEAVDASLAADRLLVDLSADGKLLQRYEAELARRVHQSLDQLARIRKSAPQHEATPAQPERPEPSRSETTSKAPQTSRKGSRNEAKAPAASPPSRRAYRVPNVPPPPAQPSRPHLHTPPIPANPRTVASPTVAKLPRTPVNVLLAQRDALAASLERSAPGLAEELAK